MAVLRVWLDNTVAREARMEILDWRVIDCAKISNCEQADLNKTTLAGAIYITTTAWHKEIKSLVQEQHPPDWIFLEAQPMRNRKMQFVSHNLLSFLLGKWSEKGVSPQACFVSGRVKLQEADFQQLFETSNKAEAKREQRRRTSKEKRADESKKYNENKKYAKLMCETVCEENCFNDPEKWLTFFRGLGYKRDDAADALLQGFYKARDILRSPSKTNKPSSPRRAHGVKFKRASKLKAPRARTKARKMAAAADEDDLE